MLGMFLKAPSVFKTSVIYRLEYISILRINIIFITEKIAIKPNS